MTDADPFLEAIWANPDDDLPRLVYADWLDENGQATYAEFIRVDCQLERREPMAPTERDRLRQHRHELRTKLAAEWDHVLGEHDRWVLFESRRGLFEPEAVMDADVFLRCSPNWWPCVPIRSLTVLNPDGHEQDLAAAPYLRHVQTLRVGRCDSEYGYPRLSDQIVTCLARMEQCVRLTALGIGPVRASRKSLRQLSTAPFLPQLGEDGLFVRVLLGDDYEDIGQLYGSRCTSIEQFLAEHGDQLPEE